MEHRGEILERAVRESGFSITKLAEKLGKSRQYMYNLFSNPDINPDVLIKVGKIIGYDFTKEVKVFQLADVEEPGVRYKDLEAEVEYWKNKYLVLMEKYQTLLERDAG